MLILIWFWYFRSTELRFESESDYKGIPALRYKVSDTFLQHIGPEYGTECFCSNSIPHAIAKPNGCLYSGALDLMPCLGEFLIQLKIYVTTRNSYKIDNILRKCVQLWSVVYNTI